MVNFRICQYKIAAIAVNLAIFESRLADAWPTLGRQFVDQFVDQFAREEQICGIPSRGMLCTIN